MLFLSKVATLFHMDNTKGKVVRNLSWALLGKIVNLLSSLIVGILVARYLGVEQYGLMNYVISFVLLFQIISSFGLDNIESREEARSVVDVNTIIGTAFGLRVLLGIICTIACVVTSCIMESDSTTIIFVAIYSSSIMFNTLIVIRNYYYAIVENKKVVLSEISRTCIGVLIKVVLLLFSAPLIWFIIACAFDFLLVGSGYVLFYLKESNSIRKWTFSQSYALFLLKESFPLLLTSTAVIVYQRIDQVMIGQLIDGPGHKEQVGFFSVASRFVEILIYIPMLLSRTINPILVRVRERSEEEYKQKAQYFMNVSFWGTLFMSILVSITAYWLVVPLFGKAYILAVPILQVMSFKAASVALSSSAGGMLVAERLQKYAFYRDSLGCLSCIVLNWVLLPKYGAIAAAVVAILSNVVAGYFADALIPAYRHIFIQQTKTILFGWKDAYLLIYKTVKA